MRKKNIFKSMLAAACSAGMMISSIAGSMPSPAFAAQEAPEYEEPKFEEAAEESSEQVIAAQEADVIAETADEDVLGADGGWTVTRGDGVDTAEFDDMGFVYHSIGSQLSEASSGGKDCVYSGSSNGKATNGIITIEGTVSYADYTATDDGTLTVYVGNASSKTGYVSTKDRAIGTYVPGGTGNYDAEGFKVVQGTTWATLYIEVKSGETYYVNVSGSKMKCYGAEFTPYAAVHGSITINGNAASEDLDLKFINKEDSTVITVTASGGTYEKSMKPGSYQISLSGEAAKKYAVSDKSRILEVSGAGQEWDIALQDAVLHEVSGKITGFDAIPDNLKILFVPENAESFDIQEAVISDSSYSVTVPDGERFNVSFEGAYDYQLSEEISVVCEGENITRDIAFSARALHEVSGGFIGLTQERGVYEELSVTPDSISFINVDDGSEYEGSVSEGKYSVNLRQGAYLARISSNAYSTSTHVVVEDAPVSRNLLLKKLQSDVKEYRDTLYVGKDREFRSVQAAVDEAQAMGERGEDKRVTIKIAPGTYREQVVIRTPYITLESDGGNRDNTRITWYYGIGYKYYSCVESYYDPYADYDRFEKGNVVKYWGAAVITESAATGFCAKDVCFENSFNKYMTDEEIEDGAEPNGIEKITVARRANTVADSRAATERAAALVNYADRTEFLSCAFIGSQDTLYTCNRNYDAYYKNCYIEGQTDFIYGNGDVIFDGCELNFCGYSETAAGGYLTAQSSAEGNGTLAEDGYIFRNCFISYNSKRKVTAGYLGRMWGNNCTVAFINTKLQEPDMIVAAGWTDMNQKVSSDKVRLVEYNTTCNGKVIDYTGRAKGVVESIDGSKYSVKAVFIDKGWTPAYYTEEKDEDPQFVKKPGFSSNGDLNIPKPGEKVTVSYSLGDDLDGSDASLISWYAVEPGYDDSSLEALLAGATLLKSTTAVSSRTIQIPMECAGKYLMVVVTPMILSGRSGEPEYLVNRGDQPVGSEWSDPDDVSSIAPGSGINIYLAGDSTVKDYSALGMYNSGKILAEGSWGEFFQAFFNDKYVTVNNYAQGGRAVRSFLNEGKLDDILGNIKEGDYLFIQFGHNDCANGKAYYEDRFVPLFTVDTKASTTMGTNYPTSNFPTITPTDSMKNSKGLYEWNCGATYKGFIQYYIDKALEKKAIPVVVTPVSRLYYDGADIKPHHDANMTDFEDTRPYMTEGDAYVTACREVYEENRDKGVLFLDAFGITKQIYIDAYNNGGGAAAGEAMMAKGEKTHSNKSGGVIQAAYLAKTLQDMDISISKYVKNPVSVYGEEPGGEFIFEIDKAGRFIARDKEYKDNAYMTQIGQEKFDEIKAAMPEPDKEDSSSSASGGKGSSSSSSAAGSKDSSSSSSAAGSKDSSSSSSASTGKDDSSSSSAGKGSAATASENRVKEITDRGSSGYGSMTDTVSVNMAGKNGKSAEIVIPADVKTASVTVSTGAKLTLKADSATDFVSDNPAVKVNKKGVIKIKKGFEGQAVITYTQNGETKTITITCVNPSIDTLGNTAYQVNKLNLTATVAAGDVISFAVKAPINAAFDTSSGKFKNKGVMDQFSVSVSADGLWKVTGTAVKKGTVTLPVTLNGKVFKIKVKIKIKM